MKLRAIRMYDVRQFAGRGVALEGIGDGLNSFAQPNETGKSTFFDALQEVLFKKYSSKDKDIRNLQPYAGGHPHIEVELERNGQMFRIEKRFLGGPARARVTEAATGRMLAQQEQVQDWLNETLSLGEQGSGPAGLLWVQQGNSWHQGGGTTARGRTLSSMVTEQLDAVTAGERMRTIMDRTAAELDRLVTASGRSKAGGPLHEAQSELDALSAEEAALSERHAALQRDLVERDRLRQQLAAAKRDTEEAERQKALLAKAEKAEADATAEVARLPELQRQQRAAETLRLNAIANLDRFVRARTEANRLKAEIATAQAALPAQQEALEVAAQAVADATQIKAAAQQTEQDRERLWTAAVADQRNRERTVQLDDLRKTQRTAEAASKALTKAIADMKAIVIDAKGLTRIEQAARELDRCNMAAEASATRIDITYQPDPSGAIRQHGEAIADGARLFVNARTVLEIEGVGTIAIEPGGAAHAADAEEKRQSAERSVQRLLAEMDISTPEAAREAMRRKELLAQEIDGQRTLLGTLVPDGLVALNAQIKALEESLSTETAAEDTDPTSARAALEDAKSATAAAEAALGQARQRHTDAQAALRDANDTLKTLTTQMSAELTNAGPEAEWEQKQTLLATRVGTAETNVQSIAETLAALEGAEQRHALAKADVQRLREAEQNRSAEIHRLELRQVEVEQRFRDALDDGIAEAMAEVAGKLSRARDRLTAIEQRVRALHCLNAALTAAHRAMRETYFKPVNAELRPLLNRVLRGEGLVFDDESYEPRALHRAGAQEAVDRLSGGTQEQIAILTRLAFARLMARNGRPTPVILDDALIFTDDDRIEDMFTILNAMRDDLQILVLTCRQRAFQSMGGTILGMSDWHPGAE